MKGGETPKPKGGAFRELLRHLRQHLDARAWQLVTLGALDRGRAENLVREAFGHGLDVEKMARAELAARLVAMVMKDEARAYNVVRELDRATVAERGVVGSTPEAEVASRFGDPRLLRLRRHGARLLWALARDERPAVASLAGKVVSEFLAQSEALLAARSRLAEQGATVELEAFDRAQREATERLSELEQELSTAEGERQRLTDDLERQRAALAKESERAAELRRELDRLRAEQGGGERPPSAGNKGRTTQPVDPSRVAAGDHDKSDRDDLGSLRNRLRRAEKDSAHLQKQLDAALEKSGRVAELEQELLQLRMSLERLRDLRARERSQAAPKPQAPESLDGEGTEPMVESPRRRRAQHDRSQARIGLFVDVANLAGAARRLFERPVDYRQLLVTLTGGRRLVEAHAYAIDKGLENDGESFARFAQALREVGYRVHRKVPKTLADGTLKADWDVGMTVDVLERRAGLDIVVLATGDGDFVPLVETLRASGLRVEAAGFEQRVAAELRSAVDAFLALGPDVLES